MTQEQHFEGAVDFFELTDADGNKIGFVTEVNSGSLSPRAAMVVAPAACGNDPA